MEEAVSEARGRLFQIHLRQSHCIFQKQGSSSSKKLVQEHACRYHKNTAIPVKYIYFCVFFKIT